MEPFWYREFRRASRRTNSQLTERMSWSLIAAGVGVLITAILTPESAPWWMRAVLAVAGLLSGPLLLGGALFIRYFVGNRTSGFQDKEWRARHDDSAPAVLFLELGRKGGGGPDLTLDLELRVKSGGTWGILEDRDLRLWPDNVIRCRLDLIYRLYPGGFYQVRWFRRGRGKFVEITREKFQLKNHSIGALMRSEPRIS